MSYIKAAYEFTDDVSDDSPAFDGAFVLLLAFALAVRVFQSVNTQVIELDSYTIIEIARTFGNLSSLTLMDFAVNVHPLFPFLMALVSKCGIGYEAAGKALSILFGTLTIFPVYLMAKDTYGRKVGRYSAFLFAIHPYLFVNASNVLRDSMSIFFIVMTFFIAWKGFQEKKDRYLVLSGCMAALAYLTKAEGLFCIVAVFLFIWMRDPHREETTVRDRLRSTISFASVALTAAVCLIIVFSLKAHSFSLSVDKPLSLLSLFSQPPGGLESELTALEGISTGLTFSDMALAFFLEFLEAIFAIYVFLLGVNLVRLWTKDRLLPLERYYLFIIVTLLLLDFVYFSMSHLFSRRYFLSLVVLLMGFMAYGLRLLQARVENLLKRRNGSVFVLKTLMVILVAGMVAGGLIKGSYYWEFRKASLKSTGYYILSHSGAGRTILTDDPRIAYYANGSYRMLTEDALREATSGPTGACPYDFIVFYSNESLMLYEKYARPIADSGFIDRAVLFPPRSNKLVIVECSKR
jgi:hypothetical protein